MYRWAGRAKGWSTVVSWIWCHRYLSQRKIWGCRPVLRDHCYRWSYRTGQSSYACIWPRRTVHCRESSSMNDEHQLGQELPYRKCSMVWKILSIIGLSRGHSQITCVTESLSLYLLHLDTWNDERSSEIFLSCRPWLHVTRAPLFLIKDWATRPYRYTGQVIVETVSVISLS